MTTWRIGLDVPSCGHGARLHAALHHAGMQVVPVHAAGVLRKLMPPPAFDLLLCNPFASTAPAPVALTAARSLAGQRPLLVLTPQEAVELRVLALRMGADDAMAANGDLREVVARIKALLRRARSNEGILACDELEVDLFSRCVHRGGQPITMPLREFDLLARLARSPDQVVTRDDLLRAVWRLDFDPGTNRIEVHISRLRQRVDAGHAHAMLRTIKGSGYALVSRMGMEEMAALPAISS